MTNGCLPSFSGWGPVYSTRTGNPVATILQPHFWIALVSITFKMHGVMSDHLPVIQALRRSTPWLCLQLWFYCLEPQPWDILSSWKISCPFTLSVEYPKIALCCSCFPAVIASSWMLLNLWQGFKITLGSSDMAFYCLLWGVYWSGNEYPQIWQRFGVEDIVFFCTLHSCCYNWPWKLINCGL